jgi:hypothetical protein
MGCGDGRRVTNVYWPNPGVAERTSTVKSPAAGTRVVRVLVPGVRLSTETVAAPSTLISMSG